MALSRKLLKGMSLTEEQVETIIEAHLETVDGLKDEIARCQADAAALPDIQKELDDARQELQLIASDGWKSRYEAISAEFDSFRAAQEQKEIRAEKEAAYRTLLREAGISERRLDAVLRVSDIDRLRLEDGRLQDAERLRDEIREEWSDFIAAASTRGARTPTPPALSHIQTDMGKLSMPEYIAQRRRKG